MAQIVIQSGNNKCIFEFTQIEEGKDEVKVSFDPVIEFNKEQNDDERFVSNVACVLMKDMQKGQAIQEGEADVKQKA